MTPRPDLIFTQCQLILPTYSAENLQYFQFPFDSNQSQKIMTKYNNYNSIHLYHFFCSRDHQLKKCILYLKAYSKGRFAYGRAHGLYLRLIHIISSWHPLWPTPINSTHILSYESVTVRELKTKGLWRRKMSSKKADGLPAQ